MIFHSINIPRVECKDKWKWIMSLCNKHKVNFLAIHETKKEVIAMQIVRLFWGNLSCMFEWSPSRGALGGILVIWSPYSFKRTQVVTQDSFAVIEAEWSHSCLKCLFV